MNLPLYIAIKYFFSKKKIGYVHLLSIITQVGIAIGTILTSYLFNFIANSAILEPKLIQIAFSSSDISFAPLKDTWLGPYGVPPVFVLFNFFSLYGTPDISMP